MDSERFDLFTRTLSSRRTALGGLVGGSLAALFGFTGSEQAAAHNAVPACKKVKDPKKRLRCLRRARAHNRRCHPQSPAITCAGRCGVYPNNCGQAEACSCAPGKTCLVNGGCAQVCTPGSCPPACAGCSSTNTEGMETCIALVAGCPTQLCNSTLDCPSGSQCQPCGLGGPTFCFPLCAA